ncbi:MAG: CRISPR-associated protein, partial [Chloroflexi bacterium]|nr:CRISPR-associated protein [Chloroflexota bacterium]
LSFAIRPQGPLLIKSGQESGADPTLLDMNFVRTYHAGLGENTVYLPGSSLKGTIRSYAEKIARTLDDQPERFPPMSCNPLGGSDKRGDSDYYCGKHLAKKGLTAPQKHREACPICRTFGHTSLASHLRLSDAYPLNPDQPPQLELMRQANNTDTRDGVAIDRVSGAVAVGPFNLEVVTRGAFYGQLTLHNFQLWQLGLLAIVLRDLGQGRVPMGFGKSRGLGQVAVDYLRAEIAYPGRFRPAYKDIQLDAELCNVTTFMEEDDVALYGYYPEEKIALPTGGSLTPDGDGAFGRVALAWDGNEAVTGLWRTAVPYWADFATNWQGASLPEGAGDG